jgi:hypothetical protein
MDRVHSRCSLGVRSVRKSVRDKQVSGRKQSARSREQGRLDDFLGDVSIGCGMLHEREDPVGHEPRSADSGASASHLGHLHDAAPSVDLNAAPVAGRDDFVRAHFVACVYDYLDSVTAHVSTVPRAGGSSSEL